MQLTNDQVDEMIYTLIKLRPNCIVIAGLAFALKSEFIDGLTMTELATQYDCTRAAISKNCRNFIESMDLNNEIRDPRKNQTEKVFNTWAEIAIYFNCSGNTVKRWYKERNLPAYKIGGVWHAKQSALDEWANDNE